MKPKIQTEKEIALDDFMFYPNPAENELTIKYSFLADLNASLKIYDVLGREMLCIKPETNTTKQTIDISMLPIGVYTIQFQDKNQEKKSGKFLKQ